MYDLLRHIENDLCNYPTAEKQVTAVESLELLGKLCTQYVEALARERLSDAYEDPSPKSSRK